MATGREQQSQRRSRAQCAARAELDALPPNNDGLPMPYDDEASHTARLGRKERALYHLRRERHLKRNPDYGAAWKRPAAETAESIWRLLSRPLNLRLRDHVPRLEMSAEERREQTLTAKQSLVIVLDACVRAARSRRMVTFNLVFDALAARWSDNYRKAQEDSGATQVRDMREGTAKAARRDLLRNDIRLDTLWKVATRGNPLYDVSRETARGYRVEPQKDSPVLAAFERLVSADPSYREDDLGWQLLLADDETPEARPRREICAERAYNVVETNDESRKLCEIQTKTRLLFDAVAFNADYRRHERNAKNILECLAERFKVDANASATTIKRGNRTFPSKRGSQVNCVSARLRAGVSRLAHAYDEAKDFTDTFASVYEQVRTAETLTVRTGFYRVINRRYQPTHFWPSAVGKTPDSPKWNEAGESLIRTSQRGRWFTWVPRNDDWVDDILGGLDVSSSQTQLLAILLGIKDLEELASSPKGLLFKEFLAVWACFLTHLPEYSDFTLSPGTRGIRAYDGPRDKRLIELMKTLWMRTLYGSEPNQVVRDQWKDWRTYGPGWTEAPFQKGEDAAARRFLRSLPWYSEVSKFLEVGKRVAHEACRRDRYAGVIFHDPLDGAEIRWNPVKREEVELGSENQPKLRLSLPGYYRKRRPGEIVAPRKTRANFRPYHPKDEGTYRGDYPINGGELARMVTPCLIHTIDAYFSSLVMKRLYAQGITDFVGIHDCWLVPISLAELDKILQDAAVEWLQGLGPIYDCLVDYMGDDRRPLGTEDGETGRDFVWRIKEQWEQRKRDRRWPEFLAVEDATIDWESL